MNQLLIFCLESEGTQSSCSASLSGSSTLAISAPTCWDATTMRSPTSHRAVDQLRSQPHYCAWNGSNSCDHPLTGNLSSDFDSFFFLINIFELTSIYLNTLYLFCIFPIIPTSKLHTGLILLFCFCGLSFLKPHFLLCFVIFFLRWWTLSFWNFVSQNSFRSGRWYIPPEKICVCFCQVPEGLPMWDWFKENAQLGISGTSNAVCICALILLEGKLVIIKFYGSRLFFSTQSRGQDRPASFLCFLWFFLRLLLLSDSPPHVGQGFVACHPRGPSVWSSLLLSSALQVALCFSPCLPLQL